MRYRPFQRQDYARLGMVDSGICAHDTGLGKTWAGYTFGLLKCGFARDGHRVAVQAPVLIVAPGDLHEQWIREGAEYFKVHVTKLDSQETFLSLSTLQSGGGTAAREHQVLGEEGSAGIDLEEAASAAARENDRGEEVAAIEPIHTLRVRSPPRPNLQPATPGR